MFTGEPSLARLVEGRYFEEDEIPTLLRQILHETPGTSTGSARFERCREEMDSLTGGKKYRTKSGSFSLASVEQHSRPGVMAIFALSSSGRRDSGLFEGSSKGQRSGRLTGCLIRVDRIGRHLIIGTVGNSGKPDRFRKVCQLSLPPGLARTTVVRETEARPSPADESGIEDGHPARGSPRIGTRREAWRSVAQPRRSHDGKRRSRS